jgi:hypothetical protein
LINFVAGIEKSGLKLNQGIAVSSIYGWKKPFSVPEEGLFERVGNAHSDRN